MLTPQPGQRVIARPANPAVRVQRGENLFGQFLAPQGQEVLWDEFLQRRAEEGAVLWQLLPDQEAVAPAASDAPVSPSAEVQ